MYEQVNVRMTERDHRISLAVAPGCSLFGHGRQHLADVGGQEVVHFVALKVKGQAKKHFIYF